MHPIEKQLKTSGIDLPPPSTPAGSYVPVVLSGRLAFLSGQLPRLSDGTLITGVVGRDLDLAQAQQAARFAALQALSLLQAYVGWERFERVVRLVGYVQAEPSFKEMSQVMNGASDVLREVLGDAGLHARTSIGAASLPLNAAVEIELTVAWKG